MALLCPSAQGNVGKGACREVVQAQPQEGGGGEAGKCLPASTPLLWPPAAARKTRHAGARGRRRCRLAESSGRDCTAHECGAGRLPPRHALATARRRPWGLVPPRGTPWLVSIKSVKSAIFLANHLSSVKCDHSLSPGSAFCSCSRACA